MTGGYGNWVTNPQNEGVMPDPVGFAKSLVRFSGDALPSSIDLTEDVATNLCRFWTAAFLHAGTRLLQSMLVLTEAGLDKEADLLLRSLLELTGNAAYMLDDPKSRAVKFEASDSLSRRRVFESLQSLQISSPDLLEEVAAEFDEEFKKMRETVGDALDDDSLAWQPFGVPAKTRIASIGPSWYYRLLYQSTSDFTHMNARAVAALMRPPRSEAGHLVVGIELLIRLLYKMNDVLGVPNRPGIDSYALEFSKFHEADKFRGKVVAYLSGVMFKGADSK
jgi:hypothetical protein